MLKNFLIAFLFVGCFVFFLGLSYFFIMYFYTQIQISDVYSKNEIFEHMERQVMGANSVESAVGSMEYALFYYPESPYQISGSMCDNLLETLRRNSVQRMVATLRERFPESCKGNSPIAWVEAYGHRDKKELDWWKETEWYKKWYDIGLQ
jgi:hypothetical protein